MAQQNLHSSQTLLHLLNSVPYSFLVPFVLDEFLITVVAVEWFFTSVKPFMHSQVVLLDEFLVTVVAIEWLFSNGLSGCPSGQIPYHSGGS